MELPHRRGAGLRRAARGRPGAVALACALYLAAGLLALSPALRHAGSELLGYGIPRENAVTPGDHLQSAYNLWLPGHQLARGGAPWTDPYSFQPVAPERTNFPGWPFAVVFGPLHALLGTVGAWNAFLVLTYVGAGGFAALWLRSLGLPAAAALAGGLAFALAPYRSIQTSGGHLLGPISMLLPLALYAVETRRTWLATAALASIPLSGQVHLALGAIPFFAAYAAVRGATGRAALVLAPAGAVAAGVLVWTVSLRGAAGTERAFAEVARYSAEPLDFLARHSRHGFETFVFLGWLLPVLALAGAAVLWRRERALAAVLAAGVAVPVLFALGANTPLYRPLWELLPGLGQTRVPGRLLPIAVLALAALAAFALARMRWQWAAVVAIPLLALDLRVDVYRPLGADERNPLYAELREREPGPLLERPVHDPETFEGSVYLYYAIQAQRERPLAYSTTPPPEALEALRRIRDGDAREVGVRWIVEFEDGRPARLRAP